MKKSYNLYTHFIYNLQRIHLFQREIAIGKIAKILIKNISEKENKI